MSISKRSASTALLGALLLLASCGDAPDPRTDDVPTSGHVLVLADEDLRDLVEAEKFMFESTYKDAELDIRYLPEAQLLKAVMNDSVRCWIGTVRPGGEQEAYYNQRQVKAHVIPIAMDGIAIVANKSKRVDVISRDRIGSALFATGESGMLWSSIQGGLDDNDRVVPCLLESSGTARTLRDSLAGNTSSSSLRAKVLPSLDSLISYVAASPSAMGFVPFAAISDLDNPSMKGLRDQVKLLAISASDSSAAVLPNQSTLADGSYPLRRPVYMVLCEGKSGLGTGFVSFVANHKGQRIILKHGLAPNKIPPREIEIVTQ